MATIIEFEMLAGTGPRHPSPGRVLGALLAGAHRSGSPRALDAVTELAAAPQPEIGLPETGSPVEVTAYSAHKVPWDFGQKFPAAARKELPIGPSRHGRAVAYDLLAPGAAYTFATDEELDVEGLSLAAEHVSSFGSGSDLAVCRVRGGELPDGDVLVPDERGDTRLRIWSPDLLAWYDDQHAAIHERQSASGFVPDARVADGGWAQVRRVGGNHRVALATVRAFSQRRLPEIMAAVIGDDPLPLVDQRGRVRGVSVRADSPGGIGATGTDLIDPTALPELRCQQPESWVADPGDLLISATPVAAHGDRRAALAEIADAGVEVVALSQTPLHPSQPRQNLPPVDPGLRRWWVAARPVSSAPQQIGRLAEQGFGLMRPIRAK